MCVLKALVARILLPSRNKNGTAVPSSRCSPIRGHRRAIRCYAMNRSTMPIRARTSERTQVAPECYAHKCMGHAIRTVSALRHAVRVRLSHVNSLDNRRSAHTPWIRDPSLRLVWLVALAIGVGAAIVLLTALIEIPPLSGQSPTVAEAQRDTTRVTARRHLTHCLMQNYDQQPILASMGSLAPYMQETSRAGLSIRHYIHEGIGDLWAQSLKEPGRHASWMLMEEHAEGGDVLARLKAAAPNFLNGFERQCAGGGVTLYRRTRLPEPGSSSPTGVGNRNELSPM